MQLASHGARVATRALNPVASARSMHTLPFLRTSNRVPTASTGQKILNQSRTVLTRFFAHLTTPGTLARPSSMPSGATRVMSSGGRNSIQKSLSLPVRMALSRPLQAPTFHPRAPAIPRSMTQVGLGTARNFSSARPIFQNLVQNVPIAGRAFLEADWEINMHEEKQKMRARPIKVQKAKKSAGVTKMNHEQKNKLASVILEDKPAQAQSSSEHQSDLEHYFATPSIPANVTTYLLIPLAPTPTARAPLQASPAPAHPRLLPFPALAAIHNDHTTHSHKVSSLWARLDIADVWSKNVDYSMYSHGAAASDGQGVVTVIKVEFKGWMKDEVRAVIGESGTGWCVLEEERGSLRENEDDTSSILSSSMWSDADGDPPGMAGLGQPQRNVLVIDPAQSFVLPTLDFSSSFVSRIRTTTPFSSTPSSESGMSYFDREDCESDLGSVSSSESYGLGSSSVSSHSLHSGTRASSWVSFSSDFARRGGAGVDEAQGGYSPREGMF